MHSLTNSDLFSLDLWDSLSILSYILSSHTKIIRLLVMRIPKVKHTYYHIIPIIAIVKKFSLKKYDNNIILQSVREN